MSYFKIILFIIVIIVLLLMFSVYMPVGVEGFIKNNSDQIKLTIEKTLNKGVDSTVKSVESKIDPKFGTITDNMETIKETAIIYFKINKIMPMQEKIEQFLGKKLSDMEIEYKISNDGARAFISYTGKEYTKEKIPDIIVSP